MTPILHKDGTPDSRYTISIEYSGEKQGQAYIARFCGDFIGSSLSESGAILKLVAHKLEKE